VERSSFVCDGCTLASGGGFQGDNRARYRRSGAVLHCAIDGGGRLSAGRISRLVVGGFWGAAGWANANPGINIIQRAGARHGIGGRKIRRRVAAGLAPASRALAGSHAKPVKFSATRAGAHDMAAVRVNQTVICDVVICHLVRSIPGTERYCRHSQRYCLCPTRRGTPSQLSSSRPPRGARCNAPHPARRELFGAPVRVRTWLSRVLARRSTAPQPSRISSAVLAASNESECRAADRLRTRLAHRRRRGERHRFADRYRNRPAQASTSGGVEKLVVGEALWLLGAGPLLGVAGSVALRPVIAGQLYCMRPLDPAVMRRMQEGAYRTSTLSIIPPWGILAQ
jgi:hypothetical protein